MKIVRPGTAVTDFIEAHGAPRSTPGAVHSIALIGAVSSIGHYEDAPLPPGPIELSSKDEYYLYRSLELFWDRGIAFSRLPDIRLYNRVYDYERGDFLKNTTLRADAVIFCYLFWSNENPLHTVGTRGQSELALDPAHWHRRLLASQAKVAVNITEERKELPTDFISRKPFQLVHKEPFHPESQGGICKQLHLVMRM